MLCSCYEVMNVHDWAKWPLWSIVVIMVQKGQFGPKWSLWTIMTTMDHNGHFGPI